MGFFFRRSVTFGPLRLNFSKSGIGASVGVRGARLTRSARGTTYVTLGSHGFYYRENLGTNRRPSEPPQDKSAQVPDAGEIKTADVADLVDSSKEKLVESLNRRAAAFNPARLIYVLAILAAVAGISMIGQRSDGTSLPSLPDTSNLASSDRQQNTTDEYALLIARYGQPNTVQETTIGNLTIRRSTYDEAHLAVVSVPNGCVEPYTAYQAAKTIAHPHSSEPRSFTQEKAPTCKPPQSDGSTIVRYINLDTNGDEGAQAAQTALGSIRDMRHDPPQVTRSFEKGQPGHRLRAQSAARPPVTIQFDQSTLHAERSRLESQRAETAKTQRLTKIALTIGITLLILGISAHIWSNRRRTTSIVYSDDVAAQAKPISEAFEPLIQSHAVWRMTSDVRQLDWKRNAGAGRSVDRYQISIKQRQPPRVKSNVTPIALDMQSICLYFLPDTVLYWQKGRFASIGYDELNIVCEQTRFIESQYAPSDATVVGRTWQYVRKDGGPDRRFSGNRELPIALYGVLVLASNKGLNLVLQTSASDAAATFRWRFEQFRAPKLCGAQSTERPKPSTSGNSRSDALKVLGLDVEAPSEKITEAYRRLAQQYHPDKVAGLGPELRELAEQKMKQINSAYQTLTK